MHNTHISPAHSERLVNTPLIRVLGRSERAPGALALGGPAGRDGAGRRLLVRQEGRWWGADRGCVRGSEAVGVFTVTFAFPGDGVAPNNYMIF